MADAQTHALATMTYPEVEALLAGTTPCIALIPVGSTEAHGPHLPLNTDSLIATAMAERAAGQLASAGYEAVVFPTVHYAVTDWARPFKGSTSLSRETDEALVLETCAEAKRMGFARMVLCNAHLEPDNIATLRGVAKRFAAEIGDGLLFPDKTRRKNVQRLTEEFQSGSCHAGQYETSLVLAIRPELVRMDIAGGLPNHFVPMHEKIAAGAKDFIDCGMDRAYCGNPAGATAEEGRQSLDVLATLVLEAVESSFEIAPQEPL